MAVEEEGESGTSASHCGDADGTTPVHARAAAAAAEGEQKMTSGNDGIPPTATAVDTEKAGNADDARTTPAAAAADGSMSRAASAAAAAEASSNDDSHSLRQKTEKEQAAAAAAGAGQGERGRSNDNANLHDARHHHHHHHQPADQSIAAASLNLLSHTVAPPLLQLLQLLASAGISTTGKVLAPPIHLTRTLLLPALFYSATDFASSVTPTRVKDWFSIFGTGIHHLWNVIIATPRGQIFRSKVYRVGGDVVDAAGTPSSRQSIVDGTAALVKLSEALHTPEVRALLTHLSVLGCRVVDAASTGRSKKLMHDLGDALWSGVELMADGETSLAMAEVTAYLCHALEMEHLIHRDARVGDAYRNVTSQGLAAGDEEERARRRRAQAAKRRRERNRQNARTYGPDCDTLDGDATPGAADFDDSSAIGIEEAIMGSLGDAYRVYGDGEGDAAGGEDGGRRQQELDKTTDLSFDPPAAGDDTLSLPSRVVVESNELGDGLEPPSTGTSSIKATMDDASSIGTERTGEGDRGKPPCDDDETKAFANEACDVEFLRKQITQRARDIAAEQRRNRGDAGLLDIEDTLSVQMDGEGGRVAQNGASKTPSSNVSKFYKHVDKVSAQKQAETIAKILQSSGAEWNPRAAAAAGAGNERGQDTIKSRLEAYVSRKSKERGEIGVGGRHHDAMAMGDFPGKSQGYARNRLLALILALWFLLGCIVMGGFSCYGIYMFFFAKSAGGGPTFGLPLIGRRQTASSPPVPAAPTEIVVKIVREVVHVAPDGSRHTLPSSGISEGNGSVDIQAVEEKVAEAAASAIEQAMRGAKNEL